ncbi:MAG: TonB-dependent receptor [Sphingomonas bacterium]|uniref:TonB-dependent receptor domain-containing protein n=1 Tax=Sphingomonas bacterium TaxID=1895847 RepID=UPI00261EAE1A|nr:TonB-dependent receptor [Sphingomonas bacterium]MDB5696977.1 TonB-dependent receptor [Sphingomonas bacterium]
MVVRPTRFRILLASTAATVALVAATPLYAQTGPQPRSAGNQADLPQTPAEQDREQAADTPVSDPAAQTVGNDIVVTGSFIRGTPENAALPVDVIGEAELANRGTPSTLDLIKSLPSSSGVLGDSNQFDSRSGGSEGSGSINLRALGPERTLVLLNGRRLSFNPVAATANGVVDTNLIPSAAISRVEVLKDGAAALYGSDAVAGVVNFITRTDQRGLALAADYRFIRDSDGDFTLSGSYGGRFGDLRVFLSAGYQHRAQLEAYTRDFVRVGYLDNPNGGYTAIGNPGTYIPLGANNAAIGPARRDVNCASLNGFPGFSGATPVCYSQSVQFDNLVEEENRYQVFGDLSYEISDKATLYLEGLYAHTEVPRYITSPSQAPVQLPGVDPTGVPALAGRFFVPASNPGFQSYVAANPGVFPAGTTGVQLVSFRPFFLGGNPLFRDTGGAEAERKIDAFRISGGLRGNLNPSFGYDFTVTYMENKNYRTNNDVISNRLQLALIGLGGSGCDSDPARAGVQGTPGVGACQYFNPFSTAVAFNPQQGGVNPQYNPAVANSNDVAGAFYQTFSYNARSRLLVADLVFNGQTGINLPGGEIGWALGGQYRKSWYENRANGIGDARTNPCLNTPDFLVTNCAIRNGPLSFYNVTTPVDLTGSVYAGFAELSLPVFDSLSFQAAARYEDYGGGIGSTFNPKFAGKWEVVDWLALRGSISTTFRGPPLISTDPNPATTLQNVRGIFRAIDAFGDPNLSPESATSFNIGALVDAGGFRASVDYFKFKLRDSITVEPISALAAGLYPTNTTNRCTDPAFAAILARFSFQDLNGNGTADDCAAANIARVRVNIINGAPVNVDGLDFAISYAMRDVLGARVTVGADATWSLNYDIGALSLGNLPLSPAFDAVGKLNFQTVAYPLPEWKGTAYVNIDAGRQNLRVTARYFDGYVDQRTDIFSPSVNYSTNGTTPTTLPQGKNIASWTVIDVAYRLELPAEMQFVASIDNLFNVDPPFVRLNYSYDPFVANGLGTTVKFGFSKKF